MNNKPRHPFWIKLTLAITVLILMPFAAPLLLDLILLADILGLEALILFLLYQARHQTGHLQYLLQLWWRGLLAALGASLLVLGSLYMLQPHVVVAHLGGSFLLLTFACSATAAVLLWLPPLLLSRDAGWRAEAYACG